MGLRFHCTTQEGVQSKTWSLTSVISCSVILDSGWFRKMRKRDGYCGDIPKELKERQVARTPWEKQKTWRHFWNSEGFSTRYSYICTLKRSVWLLGSKLAVGSLHTSGLAEWRWQCLVQHDFVSCRWLRLLEADIGQFVLGIWKCSAILGKSFQVTVNSMYTVKFKACLH